MPSLLDDPLFAGLQNAELFNAVIAHIPDFTAAELAMLRAELRAEIGRRLAHATDEMQVLTNLAARLIPDNFHQRTL